MAYGLHVGQCTTMSGKIAIYEVRFIVILHAKCVTFFPLHDGCDCVVLYDLKTVGTILSCQRPVFLLGVSQHIQKITNL